MDRFRFHPRPHGPASRVAALLCAAALQGVQAAPAPDCAHQLAAAPAAGDPGFDWRTLPAAPAGARGPYRIAVWGDSLTSAPNFIDAALGAAGIDARGVRPGFIQAGLGVAGLALPVRQACASAGWRTGYAYKDKSAAPAYSEGLLSMTSSGPGDAVFLDLRFPRPDARVRALDVVYDKAAPGASLLLGVSVDGRAERLIPLTGSTARVLHIAPQAPLATARIRIVSGQMRLHGFRPSYEDTPRIVLDALSVPGGQLRAWSQVDPALAAGAPDYDLILLQYGTNEGAAPAFDAPRYAGYLRTHLARVRALHPQARCILIGPPDRGMTGIGDPLKYAAIHRSIATAQRRASAEFHCGFWDWQGETGGPGTAMRWAQARPPFMQQDLTHLTARGYEASGRLFARFYPFPIPSH
jgi:lysophospholipase L1-like esterase